MTVRVKMCGITNADDTLAAIDAGADLIGLNFVVGTPRALELGDAEKVSEAAAGQAERVAVFRDPDPAEIDRVLRRIDVERIQLHGDESPEQVEAIDLPTIKALRGVDEEAAGHFTGSLLLLDHPSEGGGRGKVWDWSEAATLIEHGYDVILAGGLDPDNVGDALRGVGDIFPWGVDVATGIERDPRHKDPAKMRAFVAAVRETEEAG